MYVYDYGESLLKTKSRKNRVTSDSLTPVYRKHFHDQPSFTKCQVRRTP